jgi:uncharacterized protein (TIGR02246 family)
VIDDARFRALVVAALIGISPRQLAGQRAASAVDSVRAVAEAIIAADNARDIERVLRLYADDAILLPPNESPVIGKAAIGPRYETLFRTMLPAIRSELAEVEVGGEWAFVRGRNTGAMRPIVGGPERQLNDVFLMVLRRGAGGEWRIARLIWHPGG